MRLSTQLMLAVLASVSAAKSCTNDQKIQGVKQEIATIRSHSAQDAQKIPYAAEAYRVFTITPNETKPVSVFVPAGVNAVSTRAILVGLGTLLDADVPQNSDKYRVNPNGTVTVDYIQLDRPALQKVDVREIHSFNDQTCEIVGITGYVRGNLEDFTGGLNAVNLADRFLGTVV